MPAKCGWSTLKQGLPGNYYPKGWRISEGNSSRPCVCASRNNFAAGKGAESDVRQVQGCLACFSGATWQILPASGCAQDRAGVKSCIELLDIFSLMIILDDLQCRGQWYSFDTGCGLPRIPWYRPRRSTRQSRCRRSSRGRYQVSARRTSVLRVGCLMWLTYSIDFIVPAKIGEESILAKDINNYKSHAYILVFFGVFWQKLVPIINND